jgi:flagellar hook-basal body complex protein FliE
MIVDSIGSASAQLPSAQWIGGSFMDKQDFGSMLMEGAEQVDRAVQSSQAIVTDFAAGGDMPPHQVMLALEEARMQLQFALQVRSKLVEGYQELMRMQI